MSGILYIVATHIGNVDDLTFRAKKILNNCDLIICEELKPARQLLKNLNLIKEIILLNEHNEKEISPIIIEELKKQKNSCLISDSGTPVFSDPGQYLLKLARENNILISIIPGPDSLIPSLIVSGFDISKFYFAGWLPQKSKERKKALFKLKDLNEIIAIMDTPYRLKQLLSDIVEIFHPDLKVSIACDLTTTKEKVIRGNILEVYQKVLKENLKCEFVLVIDNKNKK